MTFVFSRLPRLASGVCWMLCGGCLEASFDPNLYSSYVLPAGTHVPRLEDDPAAAKKLDANDGLGTTIPLHSSYAQNEEKQYWDLGTLTATTLRPMFIFLRPGPGPNDPPEDVGHPNLIDSIPGDSAYSPLRQVYVVYVTQSYNGEQMTSVRAVEDAAEIGIVSSPIPMIYFVNCAVTLSNVQMQTETNGLNSMSPEDAYYRGKIVKQFCFGGLVQKVGAIMLKDNSFTPGNAYLLRRASDAVVYDEGLLKQDVNEDGDQLDTNTVFDARVLEDPNYTPVWRSYEVIVGRDFKLGDAKSEADLFDKKGSQLVAKPNVISFRDTGVFLNRPMLLENP